MKQTPGSTVAKSQVLTDVVTGVQAVCFNCVVVLQLQDTPGMVITQKYQNSAESFIIVHPCNKVISWFRSHYFGTWWTSKSIHIFVKAGKRCQACNWWVRRLLPGSSDSEVSQALQRLENVSVNLESMHHGGSLWFVVLCWSSSGWGFHIQQCSCTSPETSPARYFGSRNVGAPALKLRPPAPICFRSPRRSDAVWAAISILKEKSFGPWSEMELKI